MGGIKRIKRIKNMEGSMLLTRSNHKCIFTFPLVFDMMKEEILLCGLHQFHDLFSDKESKNEANDGFWD